MRVSLLASLVLALAAAAALLCVSSVSAHFGDHPLSKIRVENIKVAQPSGTITINAPVLNGTGSTVTVSWSGMSSTYPGDFDWIGVWSPKPAGGYNATTPAKYKYIIPDGTGSGSTSLWLVNMRASYVVVYFTGGLIDPVLLAESAPVEFSNYHVPLQIHLALTGDPTQMRVNWNSQQNMFPSLNYGDSPANLSSSILRVLTTTYAATDLCGAPGTTKGWTAPGYLHSALITGLQPATQYYYQLGDESRNSKSAVLHFWTAPVPAPQTEVDFVIFGDLGQVELDGSNEASQMDGSILTTTALAKDFADGSVPLNNSAAVFHIGDISYARGYASLWEQFWYQLSGMSEFIPWMVADGNHERDFPNSGSLYTGTDSGGECGVPYRKRFSMPNDGKPDDTWWSLNWGPIHFLIMSTEHAFAPGSAQYAFIQADLAAVDRSKTPWLILAGHRPMYIDSTNYSPDGGDQTTAADMRAALEPLMLAAGVDAAFWGHHHSYQRSCPVSNGTCVGSENNGTIHIVTGAAGAGFSTNLEPTLPTWAEFVECNTHGYIRARVRQGVLTLDFVSANDRSILDSVDIPSRFATLAPAAPAAADAEDDSENDATLWEGELALE